MNPRCPKEAPAVTVHEAISTPEEDLEREVVAFDEWAEDWGDDDEDLLAGLSPEEACSLSDPSICESCT